MKLFATTILLFVTFYCLSNNKTEKINIICTHTEYGDTALCSKTFTFQLKGNVTKETSNNVIEYILNKKGICNATIDQITKIISIDVVENMDYNSIKGLIDYSHHLFLLEGTDPTINLK